MMQYYGFMFLFMYSYDRIMTWNTFLDTFKIYLAFIIKNISFDIIKQLKDSSHIC
jgi:hypothetical protein